jgi:hypothetical protein
MDAAGLSEASLRMRDLVACKPYEATGRSLAGSCEERGGVTTATAAQSSAYALA